MLFWKRKSRKQLLQEIEELNDKIKELEAEVIKQQKNYKVGLSHITKKIKTVSVSCIYGSKHSDQVEHKKVIEDCLCKQLAKELFPYMSYETYKYAPLDPYFYGEEKYIATIKIVDDNFTGEQK